MLLTNRSATPLAVFTSFFKPFVAESEDFVLLTKKLGVKFATVKDGDVMFTDFSVINDGSKTLVMVKDIKILDTLAGAAPGSVKYKQLTRVKMPGLAMVVISDLNYATGIGVAGALTAAGAATVSQRFSQWLFAPND